MYITLHVHYLPAILSEMGYFRSILQQDNIVQTSTQKNPTVRKVENTHLNHRKLFMPLQFERYFLIPGEETIHHFYCLLCLASSDEMGFIDSFQSKLASALKIAWSICADSLLIKLCHMTSAKLFVSISCQLL